ncbi:cellobiose phosphorylase [Oceanisphaera avium]|uniref:Cellobiose phosphorylase n=1 Tax=Oceanisphaera avium TaxID=1903694 RepID=A0A1Y0CV53_9GAMM|nr:cellobiose phosphorylase [Oceanisphaera avium]
MTPTLHDKQPTPNNPHQTLPHGITTGRANAVPAWQHLADMLPWLTHVHEHCLKPSAPLAKAAPWLLNNEFHLRRAIRQVRQDMPMAFYQRLPRLYHQQYHGLPRIYWLARRLFTNSQTHLSQSYIVDFVNDYQGESPLNLAELWALGAMLRLVCLEVVVAATAQLLPDLTPPFKISHVELPDEIEASLALSQAIMVLISLSSISWQQCVEQTSEVERILRQDPAKVYGAMDFATRDRYRHAVENIAELATQPEWQVANKALSLAKARWPARRIGHVGYWLIDDGRARLERETGVVLSRYQRLKRSLKARPGVAYSLMLASITLLAWLIPALILSHLGAQGRTWWLGLGLFLAPALIIGVTLSHWLLSRLTNACILPKMSVEQGLKEGWDTLVVMPIILRHCNEVRSFIERLEMHWLSNPDPKVKLALLSDVADAKRQQLPEDEAIERALVEGVRALNERYGVAQPFMLLHRRRCWNASEGRWMGWERKRGKLEQLVALIMGQDVSAFAIQEGQINALATMRFVVTLDADTFSQSNNINRLISILAHPLNRVEFDVSTGKALRGYTFIQPRIEISPKARVHSLFSQWYSGDTALDIYSQAVSDVYQDVFGEGIFTGKGAFDVAAFHRCLDGRVPENAILSHDLFEGLHGRTGLASDVVFYEEFPDTYLAYARRAARWIRGDWQLTPWLGRQVPSRQQWVSSRFSWLGRWQMLDNLRRSLVAPLLVLLALCGWLVLPGHALLWTGLAISAPAIYLVIDFASRLSRVRKLGFSQRMLHPLSEHGARWLLSIIFLAHEASVALQAMTCALWRVHVSRRGLLEWVSAAHSRDEVAHTLLGTWREMKWAPLAALAMTLLLVVVNASALWGAAPLLCLWFISPHIAWLISREKTAPKAQLAHQDRRYLRLIARRTWLYFETFAGPDNNWLPADNYQAPPYEDTAHRSSPTNVGMLFLAALNAWDLGHIGRRDLLARTTSALDTLDKLESHDGHLLNWFDTRTLASLAPRYVSTVDSGNLAVSLLVLSAGCKEAATDALLPPARWQGLEDCLQLLLSELIALPSAIRAPIDEQLRAFLHQVRENGAYASLWYSALIKLNAGDWQHIKQSLAEGIANSDRPGHEIHVWLKRCDHHLMTMIRDLEALAPWYPLLSAPSALCAEFAELINALPAPTMPLVEMNAQLVKTHQLLEGIQSSRTESATHEHTLWLDNMAAALQQTKLAGEQISADFLHCAARAEARAFAMAFAPLYDQETHTFVIGHNLDSGQRDVHHYDLLASEARLASYFAIAKRDVPLKHWFYLGRPLTRDGRQLSLLSWNGSMFEYLMPTLLLPSDGHRLLGQSERSAVNLQRQYGAKLGLPWGISESAFATRNDAQDYQYQAFGVPALGLKYGLEQDYVVAPYASGLALSVAPQAACANLRHLEQLGLRGRYGFFEAADFTPQRQSANNRLTIVRSYMAHHQGMMSAAIGNALNNNIMVRRLSQHPKMRATELLLQERIPWERYYEQAQFGEQPRQAKLATPTLSPISVPELGTWSSPKEAGPQVQLLGNGRLAAWLTASGESALTWRDIMLTHWSADASIAGGGARMYLSVGEEVWSVGQQHPGTLHFSGHNLEFNQHYQGLLSHLEIMLAAEDDAEFRRLSLFNDTTQPITVQVTSYAQPVLASQSEYERHPAFSKLFIHSEHDSAQNLLLFQRRARRVNEHTPVLIHRLITDDPAIKAIGYTSCRREFFGRQGDILAPLGARQLLQGATGWTLDAAMVLQAKVVLAPHAQVALDFITAVAATKEKALNISKRYPHNAAIDWARQDAIQATAVSAHALGLDTATLADAQRLCANLVLTTRAHNLLTPMAHNLPSQPQLWSLGISGDLPIVLLCIKDALHMPLLEPLIRVHKWWQRCGLKVDLVCMQAHSASYQNPVRERLFSVLRELNANNKSADAALHLGAKGGIHLLDAPSLSAELRDSLAATARITLDASVDSLAHAMRSSSLPLSPMPLFQPLIVEPMAEAGYQVAPLVRPNDLLFDNGVGGFVKDSGDYLIHLDAGQTTPTAWSNILANETFGSLVTEAGLGFTWGLNSGEHRLTPWSNDPLLDAQAEALYLRDEQTGAIWTPTPLPAGGAKSCQVLHQTGATTWRRHEEGLEQTLSVCVAPQASVKLMLLTLTNPSPYPRRITATYYAHWQLGAIARVATPHVVAGYSDEHGILLARNDWDPEFAGRTAFLASSRVAHSVTCDRASFIGANNDAARPAGLIAWSLDGNINEVVDSCAAFQVHITVPAHAIAETVFVLGEGEDSAHAQTLASTWRQVERVKQALLENKALWQERLSQVQVSTPNAAFNIMVNRWLNYQSLASRIFARAGFQQASGAVGFRDQLQDMMSLLLSDPTRVRSHLLACAAHQFEQGDVLHWWHPPSGRGVKTRCSDDMLWLVYGCARYVMATQDIGLLTESVAFLSAPPLHKDERDRYGVFSEGESGTVFEHCRRALEYGMTQGAHGLPLMAGGDWNDGMDRVGDKGKGESVWLAWFIAECADGFATLCELLVEHNEGAADYGTLSHYWRERAHQVRLNIEATAWDGAWYVRAFDDEGVAWGSKQATECQIDSISQSWSALAAGLSPSAR